MSASDIPSGNPRFSAHTVLSRKQGLILLALVLAGGLALALNLRLTLMVANVTSILFYLLFCTYKLALQFISLHRSPRPFDPDAMPPGGWPAYSVMVPLYHEQAAVPGLMAHLRSMDYPPERLQILLLVEADDDDTQQAIGKIGVTAPFEVVLVPVSQPRTKPKACNFGLSRAAGDYLVIFDAEDRPETDQLKKAAQRFSGAPAGLVCLQAQLNYYNRDHNWLTRFFTAEYSCWYDYCLPGLVFLDAPIPLGGTSNHFPLTRLRELGGWDPFNVTEDCDLGIRLYRFGLTTELLDSTTWEEAVSRVPPWIRQRSRWVKGYLQTYLVHLREHHDLLRTRGPGGLLHFHFLFGATCFCLLMNPFYWLLTLAGVFMGPDFLRGFFPFWVLVLALISFLAGNFVFILSGMLACLRRGYYHLMPQCLLMPVYWVLMSIGAWKGALQLITRPFYWEKTPHAGADQ
jgi:cellulose synthase/poly-beta-1,6-N-acetylglucosamine synthase-like glycosyltransferase